MTRTVHHMLHAVGLTALMLLAVISIAGYGHSHAATNTDKTTGQSAGSIPYISGGVGKESRDMMKQNAGKYNTTFIFTAKEGVYLASVPVTIKNAQNEVVLEVVTDGPILMTSLPSGKYTVEADAGGQHRTASVYVPSSNDLRTHYLRFNVQDHQAHSG